GGAAGDRARGGREDAGVDLIVDRELEELAERAGIDVRRVEDRLREMGAGSLVVVVPREGIERAQRVRLLALGAGGGNRREDEPREGGDHREASRRPLPPGPARSAPRT